MKFSISTLVETLLEDDPDPVATDATYAQLPFKVQNALTLIRSSVLSVRLEELHAFYITLRRERGVPHSVLKKLLLTGYDVTISPDISPLRIVIRLLIV